MWIPIFLKLVAIIVIIGITISFVKFCFTVPFIPTDKNLIKKILDSLSLRDGMKIYDLGCGDGRFLFEAAKRVHITGIGYELSPLVWTLAQLKKWLSGSRSIKIFLKNYHQSNLSDADIIFAYLLPKYMPLLKNKLTREIKKECIVISNSFKLPDMDAKIIQTIHDPAGFQPIYIYKF